MEHLHHFGLRQDPFQNEPDLRFYFDSVSHSAPQRRIDRGLRQSKGLCVLTGESGTGKTLLTRRLLESLEEEIFDAQLMLMMPGATSASSVLNRYARMVGVEEASEDRQSLLAQIYEQLAIVREEGRHSVLMLDDAHLFNREALAEIGGLLNLEYEDRRLVSILLVGLPELDETINNESSLGQRVDVRTRIEPLDEKNTTDYLLHRLSCAEGNAATLPPEAMSALYKYGQGRPRLLNTLADNAFYEAFLGGRTQLSSEDVERAAADLGIGIGSAASTPTPAASPFEATSDVVAAPVEDLHSQTMELNEVAAPEIDMPMKPSPMMDDPADGPAMDLDQFLSDEPVANTELTTVMSMDGIDGLEAAGTTELEGGMNDMWNGSDDEEPFLSFEDQDDTPAGDAEATRVAFDDEIEDAPFVDEPLAEATLTAESLEDGLDDQLDDLFVELIEE